MNHLKININILRYNHSQVLGELLNVGVLIYYIDENSLVFISTSNHDKLKNLYPDFNSKMLESQFSFLEKKVKMVNTKDLYDDRAKINVLNFIEKNLLPKDSSQLQFGHDIPIQFPLEYFVQSDFEKKIIDTYLINETDLVKKSYAYLKDLEIEKSLSLWISPDFRNRTNKFKKDFIYLPKNRRLQ
ncbi:DUF3037 domain-containing protein [Sphingobacterium daejeonense]|uniref:DUF3037 domain-containing protein n=3 Tax=Sphingobacterium daejeonense TaxID=371142 RepID=UPI0021A78E4E|nr:DUF3037 domain-containing protein [Sphingobacterium daejeonense]MCT1529966.1 DUF3037 domain-containing protein [Sphingobacterium daejeonense]